MASMLPARHRYAQALQAGTPAPNSASQIRTDNLPVTRNPYVSIRHGLYLYPPRTVGEVGILWYLVSTAPMYHLRVRGSHGISIFNLV